MLSSASSPARPTRSMYISPPDMPHIRLEYHPDDPWTTTDLIEFTKMEEASSGGVPSTGRVPDSPDASEKLRKLVDMYEQDIGRLQETVRLQEEEIHKLKQLLKREGTSSSFQLALWKRI